MSSHQRFIRHAVSAALSFALVACGGGGGSTSSQPAPDPAPSPTQPEPGRNPDAAPQPSPTPQPQPTPAPEPSPQPAPNPEPVLDTGPEPEPDTETAPPPEPEPAPDPVTMGQWSPLYNWPHVGIHLQLLPDGRVMSWSDNHGAETGNELSDKIFLIDIPADGVPGQPMAARRLATDIFCSGYTLLADGRMLLAGGEASGGGSADANIFDYRDGSWQQLPQMNGPRWYPTTTTLANGEVLTIGGLIDFATQSINTTPQVWTGTSWRDLTSAVSNDGLYPRMHLAPNGKVFKAGYSVNTGYLDTEGTGAWTAVGMLNYQQTGRDYGTSVLYDNGKVIVIGGGNPPTATAEVINLNEANPSWRWTNPMKYARRHLNATILADGNILVTGGTSSSGFNNATQAVRPAEMWNPETESWTTMASMNVARVYHSTALLLPDGRVLAAGGGYPAPTNGKDNLDAEIFSPPYLFRGARPVITEAPAAITYGEIFPVGTPDAEHITKATWIRLSSVTHAFNMSQRINHLPVERTNEGIRIVAPSDRNLSPPGHYMLFLINSNGVPSIARIIRIS